MRGIGGKKKLTGSRTNAAFDQLKPDRGEELRLVDENKIVRSRLNEAEQGVSANRLPAPELAIGDRTHAHDFIEQRLWRIGKSHHREDRDSRTVVFRIRASKRALAECIKLLASQEF